MGTSSRLTLVLAIAALVLVAAPPSSQAAKPKRPTSLSFYLHDTLQNETHPLTNTAAEVAGPKNNVTGLGFGRVIVFNDPLTESPSLESSKIGKGQGMYIYTQLETGVAFNAMFLFSALIETNEYNGTLNLMGADVILKPKRDINVVGGTGDFELARGVATLSKHSVDGDTFIILVEVKLVY